MEPLSQASCWISLRSYGFCTKTNFCAIIRCTSWNIYLYKTYCISASIWTSTHCYSAWRCSSHVMIMLFMKNITPIAALYDPYADVHCFIFDWGSRIEYWTPSSHTHQISSFHVHNLKYSRLPRSHLHFYLGKGLTSCERPSFFTHHQGLVHINWSQNTVWRKAAQ